MTVAFILGAMASALAIVAAVAAARHRVRLWYRLRTFRRSYAALLAAGYSAAEMLDLLRKLKPYLTDRAQTYVADPPLSERLADDTLEYVHEEFRAGKTPPPNALLRVMREELDRRVVPHQRRLDRAERGALMRLCVWFSRILFGQAGR
jgi:hypothetical protein